MRQKALANGQPLHPDQWVDETQGARVAKAIGAKSYWECSSLMNEGVDDVFEAATRAAMLVGVNGHGGVPPATGGGGRKDNGQGKRRSSEKEQWHGKGCCVIC